MAAAMAPGRLHRARRRTRSATPSARRSRRVLRAQKDKFVRQAAERGVAAKIIDAVFKAFEPFERYGFNKAHATCYGLIAYQTAYLKANYPVEYMTSVLSAFRDNTEKVAGGHRRVPAPGHRGPPARRPPAAASTSLSRATRSASACWRSRTSARARSSRSSRRARTDGPLPVARGPLRAHRPAPGQPARARVAHQGRRAERPRASGAAAAGARRRHGGRPGAAARPGDRPGVAVRLLGRRRRALERPLPPATEAPPRERLRWEKELLGLYLSDHPLGELAERDGELRERVHRRRSAKSSTSSASSSAAWSWACARVITRNRETMARRDARGPPGQRRGRRLPAAYAETGPTWAEDAILLVSGRVDHKGDETVLLADSVWTWDDAAAMDPEAFARQVAAGDRGRRGPRRENGGPMVAVPVAGGAAATASEMVTIPGSRRCVAASPRER